MNAEKKRLQENYAHGRNWHVWGPYLSERQWGTVREDYSSNGDAWDTSHMTLQGAEHTDGEKTALQVFQTSNAICVFLWPSGMERILF